MGRARDYNAGVTVSQPPKRNPIAQDLRTPKYRKRVVPDKKKKADKERCRRESTDIRKKD
jgi:hypothetical protein